MQLLEISQFTITILTIFSLSYALFIGIRKFGLNREKASFLKIDVQTKPISYSKSLALILVTIKVENVGNTRIDARTMGRTKNDFLYDDGWDQCVHAGTLKIRKVSPPTKLQIFNWYDLKTIVLTDLPEISENNKSSDLDQINYLGEFQDPENDYKEVHFWLEPHEECELNVFLWLPAGTYAAKAFFLSNQTKHNEEEYWSHSTLFSVSHPENNSSSDA